MSTEGQEKGENGVGTGVIVGIVMGALVFIILVVVVISVVYAVKTRTLSKSESLPVETARFGKLVRTMYSEVLMLFNNFI